jgi:ABC-2 type transport system permease protein
MQTIIPSSSDALKSLLRADLRTQWRNRRAVILTLLVPVLILISWKGLVDKLGGAFVLSNCITVGLMAIGLMGYANSIARDRDKGVFQRLRVAPVPSWSIMASRLVIQLAMILLVTIAVFAGGYYFDHILLTPTGYLLGFLAAFVGGAVYLALGQAIVGLIKNAETVNVTCRLVYFVFIMVGMFGELGMLGKEVGEAVKYSPYGAVKRIVSGGLQPETWNQQTTIAFLITIGYAIVFATAGIKWFRWNSK